MCGGLGKLGVSGYFKNVLQFQDPREGGASRGAVSSENLASGHPTTSCFPVQSEESSVPGRRSCMLGPCASASLPSCFLISRQIWPPYLPPQPAGRPEQELGPVGKGSHCLVTRVVMRPTAAASWLLSLGTRGHYDDDS